MDETLVHSLFKPEQVNNNIINPDIYLKIFFNNKYQEIFVYKRPFLDIFLKEMNKLYNIYVFTASIELYAKPLLDKLDKNNLIKKKFYQESCIFSEGKFIKNLNSLNLNLKLNDVIIIDNNPFSFKFNKNNGIPIKSWHFDKSDAELIKIIPLLKYLSKTYDVRKYIPHIITNDEINFENINSILQKKQVKIYKTITVFHIVMSATTHVLPRFLKKFIPRTHVLQFFTKNKIKFPDMTKTYPPKNENFPDISPKNEI